MKKFRKNFLILIIFFSFSVFLVSCSSQKTTTEDFTEETLIALKKKAKSYSNEEFQEGDVPLHEFVQLTGKITQSDGKKDTIEKDDRFVLEVGESRYQIFNQQENSFKIGDEVTVYGEYYGFIKASYIEKTDSSSS